MTQGVEIELKFQLPPANRARLERALATRSAERLPLRALYFDTPDGRLAAARMALRLRQEGPRWVQTLKGRGDGLMQRLEDEVPVAHQGNDAPVLDPDRHDGTHAGRALARVLADGAAPEVLYVTEIQRLRRVLRCEGARVEVSLDVGRIRAGARSVPVCEVEFEWLGGPLQGLLTLAARWARRYGLVLDVTTKAERGHCLAAGDPAPPVVRAEKPALSADLALGEARAAIVAATLAHALPNAAALVGGRHLPDHVHQLRVALRRLRTALRAFGPEDVERDQALSALFEALGRTRDADVLAQTLAPARAAAAAAGWAPEVVEPDVVPDAAGPAALRAPAAADLWLKLIGLMHAQPSHDDGRPWAATAEPVLRRWRRRARHLARDWRTLDDPSRHRLRKQLKRLRYLLEFCAPLWPGKSTRQQLAALVPLQDMLGHWNDLVVARTALQARPASDPAAAFLSGWLARESQWCDQACAAAAAAWRQVKAPRRRRR